MASQISSTSFRFASFDRLDLTGHICTYIMYQKNYKNISPYLFFFPYNSTKRLYIIPHLHERKIVQPR